MDTITARFHVTTPLFLGGPTPGSLRLSARPFKQAITFWWRALHYAKYVTKPGDFSALRAAEYRIFGAAAKETTEQGQGPFLWRARWVGGTPTEFPKHAVIPGIGKNHGGVYLAGQGLMKYDKDQGIWKLQRPCYWNDLRDLPEIELILTRRPNARLADAEFAEFIAAIKVFGLLGGIGSRSRRCYGSVCLVQLTQGLLGNDQQEGQQLWPPQGCERGLESKKYVDTINELISQSPSANYQYTPAYSAFSKFARVYLLEKSDNPITLMHIVGGCFAQLRSNYGPFSFKDPRTEKTHKIPVEINDRHYGADRRWANEPKAPGTRISHPRRIAFGLPLGITKSHVTGIEGVKHDRRASPLLLHIHHLSDNSFVAIAVHLPAPLLASGENLKIKYGNPKLKKFFTKSLDRDFNPYSIIEGFMGGSFYSGGHYFPSGSRVWPPAGGAS